MDIDKLFESESLDGIADNVFGVVNNSVSEVKEMQRKKVAENVQLVVNALKKIESDISSRYDSVGNALEKRIITIKDGRDGADGRDGRNGKDGKNGRDGAPGPRGADGKNGLDGADGTDGVSVTDARIDFDGSLVISLSSGQEINVGEVVAPALAEQIKVITNGGGTSQSVIDTLASLQAQITAISGASVYKGLWNASTNTPTLASGVGTSGNFYIVSVAGSTNLDGITNWGVGDWAIYNGTAWQRVEGGAAGNFTTVTASSLTSGRVTYAGTAGLLQDSANLTFNGTTLTANTIGAFTLGGTVAGGGNQLNNVIIGTTTPLAGNFTTLSASSTATLSGLTASTALALDASKNIVSVTNTGSGNNVLATSPTITGATLTTSAFNGTVGATTPSTGAFTTVTASGLLDGANFTIGNGGGAYFGLVNDALGRGSANYAIQQGSAGNTIVGAPSGQTVTQAVNDVAITVASSTGLAVTGALSASGTNGQLDVSAASTGFARLKLANTGGSYYFGANDSTGTAFGGTAYAMSIAAPTGKVIESLINASVVTSVSSTGLAVTGTAIASTSIGVGNTTPSGGGAGIAFPATQSASTDANTLDDYEEGTWTPSIGGTATYTAQQGTYRKVGSVVFYTAYVQINSLGTGTTAYLSGLPFSTATTSNWAGSAAATTAATNIVSIYCLVGSTQINLYSRTAASASPAINTIWQNGALVEVNGFYFV